VNGNATLRNGSGATVSRYPGSPSAGDYLLTFNRNISTCAWSLANVSHVSSVPTDNRFHASGFDSPTAAAQVRVFNITGTDAPFDFAVFC